MPLRPHELLKCKLTDVRLTKQSSEAPSHGLVSHSSDYSPYTPLSALKFRRIRDVDADALIHEETVTFSYIASNISCYLTEIFR